MPDTDVATTRVITISPLEIVLFVFTLYIMIYNDTSTAFVGLCWHT
jgi:hypothetical protein